MVGAARVRAISGNTAFKFSLVKPTLALYEVERHIIPLWKALEKLVRMNTIAKLLLIYSSHKLPKTCQKGPKIKFYPLMICQLHQKHGIFQVSNQNA